MVNLEHIADLIQKADDFELMALRSLARNRPLLRALMGVRDDTAEAAERLAAMVEDEHTHKRGL